MRTQTFKEFLKDFDLIRLSKNRILAVRKNKPLCFAFYDYSEKERRLIRTL
jgi:hypothetical protein